MKKFWILFILVTVASVTNAQGLVERYVRATEILQTNLHFVYQGTYTPVQDITYHEFSADSLTWRKDFQEGDCYIRFANTTTNSTNPYTGLTGYHNDWWVFNFCTCNGAIQEGGGSVDTIFVDYGTIIDTVLVQQSIKIPQPDTITGSTVNYQDTLTHTHELVIYIGDNEDVDTTGLADGYVLKYNAITENWEPHPDLIGAGASGELTVSEIDDSPSVENVVEIVVPADRLENLGAGKVYLDLTLDPVNGENDYWRTDTVRVAPGDTTIAFSSPLPAADYIVASLYAVLDNGNRQDLQYDSLATTGFKVLSVIDSAWVHYIAIRNVDSLLSTVADIGRVYASATDTTIGYLNQSVDDSTITVINQELTVINAPDADSLGGVAASAYLLSASYDSTFVWLNTDTLFVGSDTIIDNIIANYDTTGFRIDQSQITNLGSIDSIFTWVSVDTLFLAGDTAIAIQKEAPGLADNLILASKAYVDSTTIGAGGYTDEQAQDAVGNILTDTRHVSFTYDDPTPYISATVDSTYVTFSLDTLFIGGDTISNTLIADYDTTGFRITENQISDLQNYLTAEVDGSTTNELNTGMSWNNGTNTIAVTDAGGSVEAVITGFLETEVDPIVGAVNGIVKANGAGSISAAVDGTDYNSQSLDDVLVKGNTSTQEIDVGKVTVTGNSPVLELSETDVVNSWQLQGNLGNLLFIPIDENKNIVFKDTASANVFVFNTDTGIFTSDSVIVHDDAVSDTQSATLGQVKSHVYATPQAVTYSATPTHDFDVSSNATITLTGDVTTYTLSNVPNGGSGDIAVIQNATGGYGISGIVHIGLTTQYVNNTLPTAANINALSNGHTLISYKRMGSFLYIDFEEYGIGIPMTQTDLSGLGLSSEDVDARLIYLADIGTENELIDITGNSARTSASDDAVDTLIANGNVIYEDL